MVQVVGGHVDEKAEARPHREITADDEPDELRALRTLPDERVEQRDQRKARRQHHGDDHQRPSGDEEQHLGTAV